MKNVSFARVLRPGLGLAFLAAASILSAAEPIAEIAAFSGLAATDRARLEKGDVVSTRLAGFSHPRGQAAETLFIVEAPVEKTLESLRVWNGSRHSELKVYLHTEISGSPGPADFQKLSSAPSNGAVKEFANSAHHQLSAQEAEQYPKTPGGPGISPVLASYWGTLLQKRAQSFLSGGAGSQAPYAIDAQKISVAEEVAGMMRAAPKIRAQFQPALDAVGASGKPAGKASLYWELVNAEGRGIVNLGAFSTAKGKTLQCADLQFFASGNYYTLLTLFQLSPTQVNGKPATFVWRGDFLSAASVEKLRGIERNAAGGAFAKEVARLSGYFQKDTK